MKKPLLYHIGRLGNSVQLTYRLKRRTAEIINVLEGYPSLNKILDIGTADGLMLSKIKAKFITKQCIGIDISFELLWTNTDNNIQLLQANALHTPFKNEAFDIIIATALVEHLSTPFDLLEETYRLLKNNGIIVITTPDPLLSHLAVACKVFKDVEHKSFLDLNVLKHNMQKLKFKILKSEKFMFSPIGFPFELQIEQFIKKIKLDFLLANQLIIGQKIM